MLNRSQPSRLSFVRLAAITLIIGLILAIATNASAATGYAFIDSITDYLGLTATIAI